MNVIAKKDDMFIKNIFKIAIAFNGLEEAIQSSHFAFFIKEFRAGQNMRILISCINNGLDEQAFHNDIPKSLS